MKTLISTQLLAQVSAIVMTWTFSSVALGQPAQTPLLTKGTAVAPNIVFMLDDSGSMGDNSRGVYLFQDASRFAWGLAGSGNMDLSGSTDGVNPKVNTGSAGDPAQFAQCSPEINQLYYNPNILYAPPFNNAGVRLSPATSIVWGVSTSNTPTPVCSVSNLKVDPLLYRYKGTGAGTGPGTGPPYSDGVLRLTLASSYTTLSITTAAVYPKNAARTDCVAVPTQCSGTEELQNFKNWSNWYRVRNQMARSAVVEAFVGQGATFRLGWGTINTLGTGSKQLTSGVQTYDSAVRKNFIDFLNANVTTTDSLGTPNKNALDTVGKYFQRTDGDGPWGTNPRAASVGTGTVSSPTSTEAAGSFAQCRRSNAILLTDGYYNNDSVSVGDVDGVSSAVIVSPSGGTYQYTPSSPYKDSANSNTFADVAMKYWVNDLIAGSGSNNVLNRVSKIPGVDEAFWQHLNFWAIGLGLDGTLDQSATTLNALKAGTTVWPTPVENQPSALDDMWHATINGRGGFLNAGDPAKLTASLNSMIGQILKSSSSQAGVAVSAINLTTGTLKFVPVYTSGEWTGNVIANNLDAVTGNETTIKWQVETKDAISGLETYNTLYPDLSVPYASRSQANRNIVVGKSYSASGSAVPFTFTAMTTAGIVTSITAAYTGQIVDSVLIDYLRGDRAQENTASARKYRVRSALLGDVVNSTPVFVKSAIDYGYASLPVGTTGQGSYTAFLTAKGARSEGGLFVGANDGMLHVFGENDAREVFAFVPRSVLPNIAKLADPTYVHRYYVDGPITQGDYHNGSVWKNVVVGSTGAGAKSVFAIDATNPTSLSTTNVLWEVASDLSSYSELGNVLSDVKIGLMRNGQWAAIFGNGYYSASGKAQLFVVNMNDGTLIRKIDTLSGPNNGLGGVQLVLNSNNQVIGAYGGDLLGNMWRFDLNDTNASNWSTGYGTTSAPVPLYKAKDSFSAAQPVTAAPFVMAHPSGGYLVAFGTGKFFDDSDLTTTTTQASYGIRDPLAFGTAPSPNPTVSKISGTSTLVQQTISASDTVTRVITAFDNSTSTQVISYYKVSSNAIDYTIKDGWYFKLPNSGQRTIYPVESLYSRIVRVDTIQPRAVVSDPCSSSSSGVGYNYIIDALTGGSPQDQIFDTNGDGVINSGDLFGVSGYTTTADGRDVAITRSATSTGSVKDIKILGSGGEATSLKLNLCTLGVTSCAAAINSVVKRTWRQLFLR